jgi:formate dehydrogenase major subunit
MAPGAIGTEVYLLPAACSYEKEGSIVNSGRWSQWRYKALDPPGQALDDLEIINRLAKRLIQLYQADPPGFLSDPVARLYWGHYPGIDAHGADGRPVAPLLSPLGNGQGYETAGHADPHKVGWEINGYFCPTAATPNVSGENPGAPPAMPGSRVDGFWGPNAATQTLRYGGETSSGNWLYCSHYVNPWDLNHPGNGNRQENRDPVDVARPFAPPADNKIGLFSNWSYCWPLNRRIIYNGASVFQPGHPNVGQPLAPHKWVVAWDAGGTVYRTPGNDVTDGYKPPGAAGSRMPFIMHREGVAHLFGPGREDGPFPEHYEPWETVLPVHPLEAHSETPHVLHSPTLFAHARPDAYEHPGDANPDFPIVGTTYRVSEHWQAGQLTRNNPWLCQLQPDAFVEMSEELAAILGIVNGDTCELKTQRTELYGKRMRCVACVTPRFETYTIDGGEVHHIGVIWHFGYTGCCTGHSANLLTPHVGDANTGIPESKAFICNIRKYPSGSFLP